MKRAFSVTWSFPLPLLSKQKKSAQRWGQLDTIARFLAKRLERCARTHPRGHKSRTLYASPQKYLLGLSQEQYEAMREQDSWPASVSAMMVAASDELGIVQDNPSSAEAIQASTEALCVAAEDLTDANAEGLRNVVLTALAVEGNTTIDALPTDYGELRERAERAERASETTGIMLAICKFLSLSKRNREAIIRFTARGVRFRSLRKSTHVPMRFSALGLSTCVSKANSRTPDGENITVQVRSLCYSQYGCA